MKVPSVAGRAPSVLLGCMLLLACFDISATSVVAGPVKGKPSKVWSVKLADASGTPPRRESVYQSYFRQGGGKVAFVGADAVAVTIVRECGHEAGPNMRCAFETLLFDASTGSVRKSLKWDSNSRLARFVALANQRSPIIGGSAQKPIGSPDLTDPHGFASSFSERQSKQRVGTWTMEAAAVEGRLRLGMFWKGIPYASARSKGALGMACWLDLEGWKEVRCEEDGAAAYRSGGANYTLRRLVSQGKAPEQFEIWAPATGWTAFPSEKNERPLDVLGDDLILLQSSRERRLTTRARAPIMQFPGTGLVRVSASGECSRLAVLEGTEGAIPSCRTNLPGQEGLADSPCLQWDQLSQTSLSTKLLDVTNRATIAQLNLGVSHWELSDVALSQDGSHLAVLFNGTLTLYQVPAAAGVTPAKAFCSASTPAQRPPQ